VRATKLLQGISRSNTKIGYFIYMNKTSAHLKHKSEFTNPLPPSVAVRNQKEKKIDDLFRPVLLHFKKYHPSGNLNFNNSGTFQSLQFRILRGKNHQISLKLNFTLNNSGCYGLKSFVY